MFRGSMALYVYSFLITLSFLQRVHLIFASPLKFINASNLPHLTQRDSFRPSILIGRQPFQFLLRYNY